MRTNVIYRAEALLLSASILIDLPAAKEVAREVSIAIAPALDLVRQRPEHLEVLSRHLLPRMMSQSSRGISRITWNVVSIRRSSPKMVNPVMKSL